MTALALRASFSKVDTKNGSNVNRSETLSLSKSRRRSKNRVVCVCGVGVVEVCVNIPAQSHHVNSSTSVQ